METCSVEKRSVREDWRMFARAMRLWVEICPQILVYRCLNAIANDTAPFFALYISSALVNELAGGCSPERLSALAALAVGGGFAIHVFMQFLQGRERVWQDNSWQLMELYTLKRINRMQYEHLENAEVTLLREKINANANAFGAGMMRIYWVIPDIMGNVFQLAISLAVTTTMFRMSVQGNPAGFLGFMNSPWLAPVFAAVLAFNTFLSVKLMSVKTAKTMKVTGGLAKLNTYTSALMGISGEDVAVFGLDRAVLGEWEKMLLRPAWVVERARISIRYQFLSLILKAFLEGMVFVITAAKAFIGAFGIGNFLLYRGAVDRFVESVSDLAVNLASVRENNGFLKDFFDLLDLPDDMYHGTLAVEKRDDIDYEIEFRNVSFKYPGTEAWVLRNVDMKFRIGDKLAIVGENGSGKTTFIKLLCRLYDPTEGSILLNGIDITRYRYDEYISLFSVVFQDYMLFQFSLAANVACSFSYDPARVEECLAQAGLGEKLQELDKGVEAVLGQDYENDGVELSGGERQKVALARALYKNAPFVVLDEPTAALDPIAEAAVYESFRELTRGKTAVFISHRLSSCRFCDDIVVFEKGRLVQRGNHDKLSEEEGKYRQLWEAQAKYYATSASP